MPFEPANNGYFQDGLDYYFNDAAAANNLIDAGYNLSDVKHIQPGLLEMLL